MVVVVVGDVLKTGVESKNLSFFEPWEPPSGNNEMGDSPGD